MNTIGVGVEGPSDRLFWMKLLHRHFPGRRFEVHNMTNRPRLIRDAGRLLDAFRGAHYSAGVLVLDTDKEPCVEALISLFDERVQVELRRPHLDRFLFLGIARPKIESWYLADVEAIRDLFPASNYNPPIGTKVHAKGKLNELCRNAGSGYNEILFAELIGTKFDPLRARERSTSFRVAWERIELAANRGSPSVG